jgi:hypothetical protein
LNYTYNKVFRESYKVVSRDELKLQHFLSFVPEY